MIILVTLFIPVYIIYHNPRWLWNLYLVQVELNLVIFFFASSSWVSRLQVKFILMALTVFYWNTVYEIEERVHLSHHCLPWIRRKYIFIILCCTFKKGIVIYLFCSFKFLWTGKPDYICLYSNFPIVYFYGILFFFFLLRIF